MKVLVVEAGRQPMVKEIDGSLKAMQEIVGGYIQPVYPWREEVALVCNEEGKMNGIALNRPLYDDRGQLVDIIAGTFFICSAPIDSESFQSLTDEQIERYSRLFPLR